MTTTAQPGRLLTRWDFRFLQLAETIACWSKDPSTKVGAVIARPDRTIASLGFNGFPRGVADTPERLENRDVKYMLTVHAEANAILAAREPLKGFWLYVAPLHPCVNCAALIVQSGIARVVALTGDDPERWQESFANARIILQEGGVDVDLVQMVAASGPDAGGAEG